MLCYHITGIVSSRKLEIIFLCCALVLAAHCVQHFFIATQGLKSPKLLGTLAIKSIGLLPRVPLGLQLTPAALAITSSCFRQAARLPCLLELT